VNRALKLERDPAKLRAIQDGLKALPPSPQRDGLIAQFDALIVQVVAAQVAAEAAAKIDCITKGGTWDPVRKCVASTVQPPPPAATRTYTALQVKPGQAESASVIAKKFTGDGNRWRELLQANPQYANAKLGMAYKPGTVLTLPASWPAVPGGATPAPGVPATPATPATPGTISPGPRTYTALRGEYASTIAKKFTGDGNRWRELLAANPARKAPLPVGMKFNPGDVLNLPANWPDVPIGAPAVTPAVLSTPSSPVMSTDSPAVAQPLPTAKTPLELAADAMVRNLRAVQLASGMPGGRGREDQSLVRKFQTLAGLGTPDGMAGPGTIAAAAKAGQSALPLVMYWKKGATASDVYKYRAVLNDLATAARAAGNMSRAAELDQSAANERGQGGITTKMPA